MFLRIVESPSWTGHVSLPNWRSLIVEDQGGTRPKNLRSISLFSKKSSKMFARQRAKSEEQRSYFPLNLRIAFSCSTRLESTTREDGRTDETSEAFRAYRSARI